MRVPMLETTFGDGTRCMVPDRVIPPDSTYRYAAARGTGFFLVAFGLDGRSMGWVDCELLGYRTAGEWLDVQPITKPCGHREPLDPVRSDCCHQCEHLASLEA